MRSGPACGNRPLHRVQHPGGEGPVRGHPLRAPRGQRPSPPDRSHDDHQRGRRDHCTHPRVDEEERHEHGRGGHAGDGQRGRQPGGGRRQRLDALGQQVRDRAGALRGEGGRPHGDEMVERLGPGRAGDPVRPCVGSDIGCEGQHTASQRSEPSTDERNCHGATGERAVGREAQQYRRSYGERGRPELQRHDHPWGGREIITYGADLAHISPVVVRTQTA
ncbi:MAG: hypothetical protein ACRDRK_22690 [Pseudonocardia sp.]